MRQPLHRGLLIPAQCFYCKSISSPFICFIMCNKTTPDKIKYCLCQLFKDKDGCYSLRELVIALLILAIITSWIAQQFFNRAVPEFMFWSFTSLLGAGCFGYSIEKRTSANKEG
jgi:hypothetical protein